MKADQRDERPPDRLRCAWRKSRRGIIVKDRRAEPNEFPAASIELPPRYTDADQEGTAHGNPGPTQIREAEQSHPQRQRDGANSVTVAENGGAARLAGSPEGGDARCPKAPGQQLPDDQREHRLNESGRRRCPDARSGSRPERASADPS